MHNLQADSTPNIISDEIMECGMGGSCIMCTEMKNECKILSVKFKGKRSLGIPRTGL